MNTEEYVTSPTANKKQPLKTGEDAVKIRDAFCSLKSGENTSSFSLKEFTLKAGEQVSLIGKSGSGKSSLLNIIAGFLPVDSGSVNVCGQDIVNLAEGRRDAVRRAHLGMVFQTYQLLEEFTVLENVLLGNYFSNGVTKTDAHACESLASVGLSDYVQRFPSELSVGQRQRVSIARALIKEPEIILADEPTGALDKETGGEVCDLLQRLCEERGSSIIFVTHDEGLAARFNTQLDISELLLWND